MRLGVNIIEYTVGVNKTFPYRSRTTHVVQLRYGNVFGRLRYYLYMECKHGYTLLDSLPEAQTKVNNLVEFTLSIGTCSIQLRQ